MFGKLGDMMGRLQEMKQKAEEIKNKLDNTTLSVESSGGDIRITVTGSRKIRSMEISSTLQQGDKTVLESQLVATVNRAIEAADRINEEEMKKVAGGLLPGLGI